MQPHVINPDSMVLQQVDGYWQKLAALILWKTVGRDVSVMITEADIKAMHDSFAPGVGTIVTHGHKDSLEFRLITQEEAERIAVHERSMTGGGLKQ